MLTQKLSNRRLIVDCLALMFGLGAWIGINGIYVQLPLLVNYAPEGWNLPAHMVMLVQFANLGPILYTLYIKYTEWARDKFIIYALLIVASLSTFTLTFVYDKTSYIFGKEHSTALLSLMFITAIVGCTSSVLFMPYMRNYREIYLVSYLVGEGLSGFVPSTVALIQGVGGNPECINVTKPDTGKIEFEPHIPDPRFSSEIFFIFIGAMLFCSFISFFCLNNLSVARGERVKLPESLETLPTDTKAPPSYKTNSGWVMSKRMYCWLLTIMAVVCFLGHGTLPSIQSYSCLPYGNVAYHLTVTLASMAGPLAMCLGFVIQSPQVNLLSGLTAIIIFLSSFVLYLAVQSPTPPLQYSWLGEFLVVASWILLNGLIGFVKMGITTLFRPDPGRGLYYTGIATQVGSLVGATITFILGLYSKFTRHKMREVSIESKDSSHPDKGGHAVIHILVVLFGISAWIGVNGIFIQLPVLVNTAPEGWNLPAYIVVVVQTANVGPAIYALLQHLQFKLNESLCILALLASGTLAMGLSTFLYDKTVTISGTEHSIVLFVLVFFLALVGCFSSVLFMPYLRDFKDIYIVSYFIGEGLSGVLPSVVALIQGVEGNSKCNVESNSTLVSDVSILRFAPKDYFSFIFSVFLVSLIAFIILNYSPFVRERKLPCKSKDVQIVANTSQNECNISTNNACDKSIRFSLSKSPNDTVVENVSTPLNEVNDLSRFTRSYLFILISILCFLGNGFFPSVQSYSCLPYGNIAYQLSITFAQFANPAVCSLALWIRPSAVKTINCLSAICLAVGSYVTYLALMSPSPPLQKSTLGVVLVVISWTILIGLISYVKLIIVSVFRRRPTSKTLFYVGAVMQTGSACGAILSFVLINFTKFFRVYDPCSVTNM